MRIAKVIIDGEAYAIPEMWLAGATRTMSYEAAILHWAEQVHLERRAIEEGQ